MTAQSILTRKGYDLEECANIICVGDDSLDVKTREHFGITEPIHLWEGYAVGDADEDKLLEQSKAAGINVTNETLLLIMDSHLINLANRYPTKQAIQETKPTENE